MDYEQMSRALLEYNWDDGFAFPRTLLDNPLCDLSLALHIFDLADGYAYLSRTSAGLPRLPEWLHFIQPLYADILAGKYPKTGAPYKAPYTRVQAYKLRKAGVPEVFLTDLP